MKKARNSGRSVALLLVEGETEEEFYQAFTATFCPSVPKKIKCLKGNFNINSKIIDAGVQFYHNNPVKKFDIYVCVDQERFNVPAYDHEFCKTELESRIGNLGQIIPVVATLMIESLFFLDINGIYTHLRVPSATRNPKKYREFRKLTHHDLSALFRSAGKRYVKGHRCESFIAALDLLKIGTAKELANMIKQMS